MLELAIEAIQGTGLFSPHVGAKVRTHGVITARTRHGFFLQDPAPSRDSRGVASSAIFVSSPELRGNQLPKVGAYVQVDGEVLDYQRIENDKPCTQILLDEVQWLRDNAAEPQVVWLRAENLPEDNAELAKFLNSFEFMLVGFEADAVFSQPSNPFGDYVVLPKGMKIPRSIYGSAILDAKNPDRWLPSFRITRQDRAPTVDVGDRLRTDVIGPLNYRAGAYQIHATNEVEVERLQRCTINTISGAAPEQLSILTLNAFNLDQQRERSHLVEDPDKDVDDDVADGRFEALADVIVRRAQSPEIVALQEIQDNDGAEISWETQANLTYELLIKAVVELGGPNYQYAELAPAPDQDGGQPGGNIRNAYLYDPDRVRLIPGSLKRLGENEACYEGSRKALLAHFEDLRNNREIALINVHLASKRHQYNIFAPADAGVDPRESVRMEQAALIRTELDRLQAAGIDYYLTGDFNDFEFSPSVRLLLAQDSCNLVETIPVERRFDYNHRGKLHTLMHAICSKKLASKPYKVEILHGNELLGVQVGSRGTRATDHAYLWVALSLGA